MEKKKRRTIFNTKIPTWPADTEEMIRMGWTLKRKEEKRDALAENDNR